MCGSRYMMDWPAARTELDALHAQKLTAKACTMPNRGHCMPVYLCAALYVVDMATIAN